MARLEQPVAAIRAGWNTVRWIWSHPLTGHDRTAALLRWGRWQIGSRILPGQVVAPFVEGTVLLVAPGMTGATGNLYVGLHEFPDMAFVLHFLRPDDLFVDVGANVGSYTVLAAGVIRAQAISVEPVPAAFRQLEANVRLNGLEGRVRALNAGLAASAGTLKFTGALDTVNHVVAATEGDVRDTVDIPTTTLDGLARDRSPSLIKVDVEGYETEVFRGGRETLARPELQTLIVELNGSGERYGFDEAALQADIESFGFRPYDYEPFARQLKPIVGKSVQGGNTIYVRDVRAVEERIRTAPLVHVLDVSL
jgi:FkbM family methyltransferase